jgi:TrpR family trp operon transcriptional repressor
MADKELFKNLINHILSLQSDSEVKDFLESILTTAELEEIPKRIEIVKLLKQGISQHKIAEKLGVGIATITRGSKELQKGKFKFLKDK